MEVRPSIFTLLLDRVLQLRVMRYKKILKKDLLKKTKIVNFFSKKKKNKTYFSLNNYVYYQLKKLGIKNLDIINKNTFDPKNNFFSSRLSIHNKENNYGRNISIIMIK